HLNICLDRCMSISQRENFENYIKTEFFAIFQKIPKISISHESSIQNECLQVLDFICGAFGYKYNTARLDSNAEYYTDLIKNRIMAEKSDLFK
ncbi:MAG: hypothetical protein Q8N63_01120, partial [Nanoarchaeota archaeon]|nr:hypothetical protein [Nanoarchaeota archaeon]